jgi:hypothetical protein
MLNARRMENWVIAVSGSVQFVDNAVSVDPGDWIVAIATLYTSNLGPSCVLSTGNKCNHVSYWADWTKGISVMSTPQSMPVGPRWALGVAATSMAIAST